MKDLIASLVGHRSIPGQGVIRPWIAWPEQYGFDAGKEGDTDMVDNERQDARAVLGSGV
jgi:hypothetical protein